MLGFYTNVDSSLFLDNGFGLIYDKSYNWATTSDEINSFRSQCSASSVLCIAGKYLNIILAACGNCYAITSQTVFNTPVYDSGVWWYNTPGNSFGFSPSSTINQNKADTYNFNPKFRLSWHLTNVGGWRLGSLTGLYSDVYHKCVYLK